MSRSTLCAVVSDIHFPHHHRAAWGAFVAWCRDHRPHEVIINGDVVDLEALSRYAKNASTPHNVIDEIKEAAREANALAEVAEIVTIVEGNHDERWSRITENFAQHLGGAIGLTLQEQFRFQGLDPRIRWVREDVHNKGTTLGPFRVRHGHKQAGKWGVKHIAAGLLAKPRSQIVGHHHRAQLMCSTAEGMQFMAIANPHLSGDHEYATDPNWQRGFTVVERFGDDATAYPVVMTLDGRFAWGGTVYDMRSTAPDATRNPNPAVPSRPPAAPAADVSDLDFDDAPQTAISRPADDAPNTHWARYIGCHEKTIREWRARGIPPSEWQRRTA